MTTLDQAVDERVDQRFAVLEQRLLKQLQQALPDRALDVKEASQLLRIPAPEIRRLCRLKLIPHRVQGMPGSRRPHYLFSLARLDAWKRELEDANYRPVSDER